MVVSLGNRRERGRKHAEQRRAGKDTGGLPPFDRRYRKEATMNDSQHGRAADGTSPGSARARATEPPLSRRTFVGRLGQAAPVGLAGVAAWPAPSRTATDGTAVGRARPPGRTPPRPTAVPWPGRVMCKRTTAGGARGPTSLPSIRERRGRKPPFPAAGREGCHNPVFAAGSCPAIGPRHYGCEPRVPGAPGPVPSAPGR